MAVSALECRHVPNLRLNLVSVSKLDDAIYNVNLSGGKLKLTRGSLIVSRWSKYCSIYKLQAQIVGHEMNVAGHDSSSDLWHRRLGHISQKDLKVLV